MNFLSSAENIIISLIYFLSIMSIGEICIFTGKFTFFLGVVESQLEYVALVILLKTLYTINIIILCINY